MSKHLREDIDKSQKTNNLLRRPLTRFAGSIALLLTLILGASNGHASTYYWTGSSDSWQSTTAWSGAPFFPGSGDNALFTNAVTYSVTLNADVVNLQSNFFSNASNTTATVTLNLNTYELNPVYNGTSPGAFNIGDMATSTTTVYLASSNVTGKGLIVPGRIVVGRFGFGTLVVTNGVVNVGTTLLANGPGGCGLLVVSGPSTVWSNLNALAVGNSSNSFGSTLVISNGAVMDIGGILRVGSGSSSGGSSNNTMLLDTGARLFTHSGTITIGDNGTTTATSSSYNNSVTVRGGAVWNCENSPIVVGLTAGALTAIATGNVLTVGTGGVVSNISHLTIMPTNTLNMAGGLLNGMTACFGTLQGFGTMVNNVTVSGFFNPFNSLGAMTFSNQLTLGNTATTTVQLGTNFNPTVVSGSLTLDGTLDITDGGGFTNGTYTLFTYSSTLIDNGLTIGTTPNTNWTYAINTSTPNSVILVVTAPEVSTVASFTGSPTVGGAPLPVLFADTSTGTITNRFWSFGDGATSNTTLISLTHIYSSTGTFDVSLTVFGVTGTNTLTMPSYITATNVPLPSISSDVTATNAALQVGNTIVVVAGDTNEFSVGATDTTGNTLTYLWSFGDGVTNSFSPSNNTVEHVYTNECGSYVASVTISNGVGAITTNFTVTVACQLNVNKLQPKLNFAKTNSDSCTVVGSFAMPSNTVFAGDAATLDIGGASLTFTFPLKGNAVNGASKFSKPTYNKKTGLWALKVNFNKGFWQVPWADYSMIDSNVPKPGIAITNLPVVLLLDTEAFMATTNLTYTAKQGKSGAAK
jgi:PKD repeat protein